MLHGELFRRTAGKDAALTNVSSRGCNDCYRQVRTARGLVGAFTKSQEVT
jgi:hypothetical protein